MVAGRTVLTAAHVVVGAAAVWVRDVGKRRFQAVIDAGFVHEVEGESDLALIEADVPGPGLPAMPLGRVVRDGAGPGVVERCHAVGYPWFAESPSPGAVREVVDAVGEIPVLSRLVSGRLSLVVSVAPRPLPQAEVRLGNSPWSGMSGAPVITAEGLLLGVVIEHADREGPSAITVAPLTAVDSAAGRSDANLRPPAQWWSRLGVAGPQALRPVPAPMGGVHEAPYWATLRQFGRTLHARMPQLVGRERELIEISRFATGDEPYRWLVGGAYVGKTALLFEAVTAGLSAEVDIVAYFLSRRASDADSSRFVAAVLPQLAAMCGQPPPSMVNVDQFLMLWEAAVARARNQRRHLLLVVDGLDEDLRPTSTPSVASLLPTLAGGWAHVLVASRPNPQLPDDVEDGHPLRRVTPIPVTPFPGSTALAAKAREEINAAISGANADRAADLFGVLTAAAGPLTVADLTVLAASLDGADGVSLAALRRRVYRFVTEEAARSLEPVGPADRPGYQFAHASLLEHAQSSVELADPVYRRRIHAWASQWRAAGWPVTDDPVTTTPRYLLDSYPASLTTEPEELAALVSDPGWVDAAISCIGVDPVLADLRRAEAIQRQGQGRTVLTELVTVVSAQAYHLRRPPPAQPDYIARQLCLHAVELGADEIAEQLRIRIRGRGRAAMVPIWTTRRASPALIEQLGHDRWVHALGVLPDGRVIIGDDDGRVLVWDPGQHGAGPQELGHHDFGVKAVAVPPDGRVVTGGDDSRVLVWDPGQPGAGPQELGRHEGPVYAVGLLPYGRIVTGGHDGRVLVWDPGQPGAGPQELGRHDFGVEAVAVVAGRAGDRRPRRSGPGAWDPGRPGAGPHELGRHDENCGGLGILPDRRVVTAGDGGLVLVWDLSRPGTGPQELGRHDGRVFAVGILPDGRVVTGGHDGLVLAWDPSQPGTGPQELGRHDATVWAVGILPDGRVVTGSDDYRALVWDPNQAGADPPELGRHDATVEALGLLPDGRVVTAGDDGRVLVWDPSQPGTGPQELGRQDATVEAVGILPDGRVVTAGDDGRVLVWDPSQPGTGPQELGRHDGRVLAVGIMPNGRVISGGEDGLVLVWDPARPGAGPQELGRHDGSVWAVGALPDGRVVTGGNDCRVLVWDPDQPGTSSQELGRHDDTVFAMGILPDGRVVTGGIDCLVLMWDPGRPGAGRRELGRHDGYVRAVGVLADGRVATAGAEGRVLVWDPATGRITDQLDTSLKTLAAQVVDPQVATLVIAHERTGFTVWAITISNS
ncbi:trypsin-like peptidase domain-containing protein [Dactylosporangium cerinum]